MNELSKINEAEETAAKVRQDLERSRAKVAASVDALRDDLKSSVTELTQGASEVTREIKLGASAIKTAMSWRTWVGKNPWGFLAGAFAVGLILGTRRRSHEYRGNRHAE